MSSAVFFCFGPLSSSLSLSLSFVATVSGVFSGCVSLFHCASFFEAKRADPLIDPVSEGNNCG